MIDWPIVVSIVSVAIALATWLTSASKSRVDNLVSIIDAQSQRITELERELRDAKVRISELEDENRLYRQLLSANGIDVEERAQASRAPM